MSTGGPAGRPSAVLAVGRRRKTTTSERFIDDRQGLGRPFLVAVGGLFVAAAAAGLLLAGDVGSEQQRLAASTMAATAAVATTVPTGLILVSHYRLGGRRADVDAGLIVILAGALWLFPTRLGAVFHPDLPGLLGPVLLAAAGAALALSGTATVADGDPDDISVVYRHRVRIVLLAIVPLSAVGYAMWALRIVGLERGAAPISAAILGMAAAQMLWSGYRLERWSLAFIGLELFGMQFSEVVSLVDPRPGSSAWLAGDLLALAGAVIGTLGAVKVAEVSAERSRRDLMEATVAGVRMLQAQATTEEALHDLRSGLLAVEAFAGSLGATSLDGSSSGPAHVDLLTAELARLRELVSTSASRIGRVDLGSNLLQIVSARPHQSIDLAVGANAVVLGRRADVLEMIQNLLDNALAHAPGSPVSVRAERSIDGLSVTVTVADRGPGFDPDVLPYVFDRGITTSAAGTGLGLHIVRRSAEALGGSAIGMNRAGGGALVAVTLPAAPVVTEELIDLIARERHG